MMTPKKAIGHWILTFCIAVTALLLGMVMGAGIETEQAIVEKQVIEYPNLPSGVEIKSVSISYWLSPDVLQVSYKDGNKSVQASLRKDWFCGVEILERELEEIMQ